MKTTSYPLAGLLLAFSLFVHLAHAQTTDSFYLRTQYIFQYLEKNRITTGMLQDYGIDFIDIENYDGLQLSDTNQVTSLKWQDLYESLYTYQINTNALLTLSPDSVNSLVFNDQQNGYTPLSLLMIQYDKFRDDAATNNLITISNDQFYDRYVNGVWQNPYEIKNAFAVGMAQDIYKTADITFRLPSNLVFNNAGTIQSIQADFADGNGWRNITLNQNITVSYPDTGYKHIQFKITLTSSQVFQSTAAIWVTGNSSAYSRVAQYDDAEITIPPSAGNSGGTMEIHYASGDEAMHQITKPLIIAEGFDPWKYETPYDSANNVSFDDFWEGKLYGFYGDTLSNLLDNNYDIIYLDYNDGTDDITRNAALLEEVIQKVDSLKALAGSTEKNVVMGISMGGLVARWALTDMEKKSENHDTRLFISYDAPMLGANVPLGFQALGAHLANTQIKIGLFFGQIGYITTVGSLAKPLQIYETPAAQELLQYYVAANPLNGNLQMDNTAHTNFMNALYSLNTTTHGYPQG
ncbi:MAG: esterase/lipase family protein, partial [Chitinophagaceae bacterium]